MARFALTSVILVVAIFALNGEALALPEAARIVVVSSGYTQDLSNPPQNDITFGLELANRSPNENAVNVQVTVKLKDAYGRSLGTGGGTISVIPAGTTFYFAGYVLANVSLKVKSLVPIVQVGSSTKRNVILPPTSSVSTKVDDFGDVSVGGTLADPYGWALPYDSTIYAVVFNAQGHILGGGAVEPNVAVEPGKSVRFAVTSDDGLFSVRAAAVSYARVSIDPCDVPAVIDGYCQLIR
jgi:hypothetical protein